MTRQMSSGIKDVAARAGVSVGTVSNVLNRPGRVTTETRLKVLAAIDELGFVRNESARQLRAGSSRIVAYVVLDAGNPFFTDVAAGAETVIGGDGLALFLCTSHNDPEREREYLDLLVEQRVRGVLITPVAEASTAVDAVLQRGVPLVLVDRPAAVGRACSVAVDDVAGGQLAGLHLLETGHTRIGFVGGPLSLPQVHDRLAGLGLAMALTGSEPVVLETDGLNITQGRRAGQRLAGLPAARRPTGIFCANDMLALGLLQELTAQGIAVPDEVCLVGYDDIEFAGAAMVPLTSVRQPRRLLGQTASELLLEEIAAGGAHDHRQVVFKPELIVRASSARRRTTGSATTVH